MAAVNAQADRQLYPEMCVKLEKACLDYTERTGLCYGCEAPQPKDGSPAEHKTPCIVKSGHGGHLWYKMTTAECLHCGRRSIYEGGIGAFCEQHAQDFVEGKIGIRPKADDVAPWVQSQQVEPATSSGEGSGGFAVYNPDGSPLGFIGGGKDMTIGQFKHAILRMEAMQKASTQVKSQVEVVNE